MKMREIIDLINPDIMEISDFRNLIDKIDHYGENMTSQDYSDQYGIEIENDTEIETQRAKLEKLRAEILKLKAATEKDRAITADYYRNSGD